MKKSLFLLLAISLACGMEKTQLSLKEQALTLIEQTRALNEHVKIYASHLRPDKLPDDGRVIQCLSTYASATRDAIDRSSGIAQQFATANVDFITRYANILAITNKQPVMLQNALTLLALEKFNSGNLREYWPRLPLWLHEKLCKRHPTILYALANSIAGSKPFFEKTILHSGSLEHVAHAHPGSDVWIAFGKNLARYRQDQQLHTQNSLPFNVQALAASQSHIAFGANDTLYVAELSPHQESSASIKPIYLKKFGAPISALAFHPFGNQLAIACNNNLVYLRDTKTGSVLYGPDSNLQQVSLYPPYQPMEVDLTKQKIRTCSDQLVDLALKDLAVYAISHLGNSALLHVYDTNPLIAKPTICKTIRWDLTQNRFHLTEGYCEPYSLLFPSHGLQLELSLSSRLATLTKWYSHESLAIRQKELIQNPHLIEDLLAK